MPELINDKPLGFDPVEADPFPSLSAEAPTLIKDAGIPEAQLQADLSPAQEPVQALSPAIPAHHLKCCYEHLVRGDTVEKAALAANIPLEAAQEIADEICAVCTKLGSEAPSHCKPMVVELVVDEPVKEPG